MKVQSSGMESGWSVNRHEVMFQKDIFDHNASSESGLFACVASVLYQAMSSLLEKYCCGSRLEDR
jgi:hypothetical protein